MVPGVAGPDHVESERRVGLVGADDAPDRCGSVELVNESSELQGEGDPLLQEDLMVVLADARFFIDGVDGYGDVVLEVEGAVRALPAGKVRKDRRRLRRVGDRVGPHQYIAATGDFPGEDFAKPGRHSLDWAEAGSPHESAEELCGGVVHRQGEHASLKLLPSRTCGHDVDGDSKKERPEQREYSCSRAGLPLLSRSLLKWSA
jgi:hypothetical protein